MGLSKYLSLRTPARLDIPWGWKDPRNTYTLPIWLDLFPEAKVIHIYRHPMDIVNSLMTRRARGLRRLSEKQSGWKKAISWYHMVQKFIPSKKVFVDLRGGSPEEGLVMWEEYMQQARSHVNSLGDQAIEIKYEDFLEHPARVLGQLSEFTGLEASQGRIEELTKDINKSRAYAFRKEPELLSFSNEKSEILKTYGY